MSEQGPGAPKSGLVAFDWTSRKGAALVVAWLASAIAILIWINPLIWIVLPSGLALYLAAARYPLQVVLILIVPLTILTALAQVAAMSSDVPTLVAFAIYVVACAYFSVVFSSPDRDRWIAYLPAALLGEPLATQLAWARFEASLMAANALVRDVAADDDADHRRTAIKELATDARGESAHTGTWQAAWVAQAAWLEALGPLVGVQPTAEQARTINSLLADLDEAHLLATERTAALDPGRR